MYTYIFRDSRLNAWRAFICKKPMVTATMYNKRWEKLMLKTKVWNETSMLSPREQNPKQQKNERWIKRWNTSNSNNKKKPMHKCRKNIAPNIHRETEESTRERGRGKKIENNKCWDAEDENKKNEEAKHKSHTIAMNSWISKQKWLNLMIYCMNFRLLLIYDLNNQHNALATTFSCIIIIRTFLVGIYEWIEILAIRETRRESRRDRETERMKCVFLVCRFWKWNL